MNEVPGRREHRLTSQRTGLESSKVVLEHIHDVVNEFLGEAHASVMNRGGNWTEVDRFFRYLHDYRFARSFSDE